MEAIDHLERALLGSVLRWPAALDDVGLLLRPDHLHSDVHQRVWRAMLDLWSQGRTADAAAVADELHRTGQIQPQDYGYLASLLDAAGHGANAGHYARSIREQATLRALGRLGARLVTEAEQPSGPAEEVLAAAERDLFALAAEGSEGTCVSLADLVREAYERIDARATGRARAGLATGLPRLDALLAGLQPSELTVVAARPSVGKTGFALAVVQAVAVDAGRPVFLVSLEQSRHELAERLLASGSRVELHAIRSGLLGEAARQRILDTGEVLRRAPVWIDDAPAQRMLRIAANARRLKRREDIALVVVDYLQLIEPDDPRATTNDQIADTSRRLKQLARELAVPVMALAQLNRQSEARTDSRPRLADLRGSGQIEQDADTVLLLHRPPGPGDDLEVIVAKQRNGPTGELALRYDRARQRFEDLTEPFAQQGPSWAP